MASDIMILFQCTSLLAFGVYVGSVFVGKIEDIPWQAYVVLYSMLVATVVCFCCLVVLVVKWVKEKF